MPSIRASTTASLGTWAGSCIRSRAARDQTNTQIRDVGYCRQQLSLLCHDASPSFFTSTHFILLTSPGGNSEEGDENPFENAVHRNLFIPDYAASRKQKQGRIFYFKCPYSFQVFGGGGWGHCETCLKISEKEETLILIGRTDRCWYTRISAANLQDYICLKSVCETIKNLK